MIKGLIFDLDGVITDSAEYHYQAWRALGQDLGIPFDRAFNERLKGISRMESLELILEHGHQSEQYTQKQKEILADKKNIHYLSFVEKMTEKDVLPGIRDLLKEAKQRQLKIALASASKNGPMILNRLGVQSYFDVIVDPSSLIHGKPNPEIYMKGADMLGLQPSECIGLEDAQAGIEAIHRAGMFAVGIGDFIVLKEADYIVSDTSQLQLDKLLENARK
ncbi:beta-phosphoglucomutase [Granulicatella sp. zg-ZJ]|uniref:beta-phosphoglucomutase n=1 Tax=Granulicatella sp. zg-ZJ TaxID=2678504 RepID=UPI0013D7C0AD|nr:beta-phosphoglucomutase [Granulicatella sp. zg-ZJ]NEW62925.1 beta-phosphoglucomutase [Granulicatella sp. zg-ZJ]